MKYKKLGNTNIQVPVIGQGCMGIGGYFSRDSSMDSSYINALKLGIELGMSFLDTSEIYGEGHSEELVGEAIAGLRDKVFIATKVSPENLSHNNILKSVEGSLGRLRTDYIDLYQIHWPNPRINIHETMEAMEQLIRQSKIRYIGVSNFSLRGFKEARKALTGTGIVSIQTEYNYFDRTIESDILPYCEQEGVTVIAYSPLDQGKIVSSNGKIQKLKVMADKYGKTMAQIVLNWLISHRRVIAIPKAADYKHIIENASAADFNLPECDVEELNNIFCQETIYVPIDRIRVNNEGLRNSSIYQTLDEALENRFGLVPSPFDLASSIHDGDFLKPVRVVKSKDVTGKCDYELVEGRIRFWAWVIAHEGKMPIPAYVRYS